MLCNKRGPGSEKPADTTIEQPRPLQLQKAQMQQGRPSTAKDKYITFLKKTQYKALPAKQLQGYISSRTERKNTEKLETKL